MVLVHLNGQIKINIKDNLKKIKNKEKEFIL
jgi:hypothetical protein